MKPYPSNITDDVASVADAVRFICRTRLEDITDFNNLDNRFVSGNTSPTKTNSNVASITDGTWTPTDASGGGLTLTINDASYTRVGRVIYISAFITWPTTVDSNAVLIGGLPAIPVKFGTAALQTSAATGGLMRFEVGTTNIRFMTLAGAGGISNAQLSGAYVIFSGFYFA